MVANVVCLMFFFLLIFGIKGLIVFIVVLLVKTYAREQNKIESLLLFSQLFWKIIMNLSLENWTVCMLDCLSVECAQYVENYGWKARVLDSYIQNLQNHKLKSHLDLRSKCLTLLLGTSGKVKIPTDIFPVCYFFSQTQHPDCEILNWKS